jgi:Nif-specific regulatory protein
MDSTTKNDWKCLAGECRIQAWPSIHRMSQVLAQSADLVDTVPILLRIMEQQMQAVRGTISLCDRHTGTTFIHQSFGLTEEQEARGVSAKALPEKLSKPHRPWSFHALAVIRSS